MRDKTKKSSFVNTSKINNEMKDITEAEIFEMTPVDYLDKMSDERAVLKEFCQNSVI